MGTFAFCAILKTPGRKGFSRLFSLIPPSGNTAMEALSFLIMSMHFRMVFRASIAVFPEGYTSRDHKLHTFRPGEILSAAQSYGEFLTVKIENMNLGHTTEKAQKPKNTKPFSVIAVAEGDGISALFRELGADVIIEGGQSKNPSAKDLVDAFKQCNTEHIIVLPNNKNVILAANQSANLYTGADIHVIKTKSIAEGYAALSVINPAFKDIDTLVESAERAASDIIGGEVTRAVRNVSIDGAEVKDGDYIAINGSKLCAVEKTAEDALISMLQKEDTDLCEIITLFVGKDVSDERRIEVTERLGEIYPDYEITVYSGGQDIYDYIVAVE